MKLVNGRKREIMYFDLLNGLYGPFPKHEHPDSPDFLIYFPDHVVGIECTEIYNQTKFNGITFRQHEAIKDRIVEKAKRSAIEKNLPPIRISVIFNGFVKKNREEYVTNAIIRAIYENYPACPGQRIDIAEGGLSYHLPNEIQCIMGVNIPNSTKHHWFVGGGGFFNTYFPEQLQQIIDHKSEKLTNYFKRCNNCWLIIAALGFSVSSLYEPSKEMLEHIYKSPFEKVFFIEAFSKYIVELKVK